MDDYPSWFSFPSDQPPPEWVEPVVEAIRSVRPAIDSKVVDGLRSDDVLRSLRPGLEALGFVVEGGKRATQKIRRPVLFGDQGAVRVAYEIDGVHDELGIVLEVEAGRGARGNAVYRDLVRTSLIVGARYLILGVMAEYRHQSGGKLQRVESYREARAQLEAIFASGRLGLPFDGILLFGY